MFDGFDERTLHTDRGQIHALVGGSGPPLLVLHGYPETHLMWHGCAEELARLFTVVAADLPGYGASHRPRPARDHRPHSKRAMGVDLLQAMADLGHARFAIAGHDRGGRVAYRMALDQPDAVSALAVLDIVPTGEVWARANDRFALAYWHWGFLAQPAPLPERLIGADPDGYYEHHLRRTGIGGHPRLYPKSVLDAYRHQLRDPAAVEAICEDYRAGATVDRELDDADRAAGNRIEAPVLALWGSRGALPELYDDVTAIWRDWARDVEGGELDASHFVVEDQPAELAGRLAGFLG
jgi:haloacetate dehalogenase